MDAGSGSRRENELIGDTVLDVLAALEDLIYERGYPPTLEDVAVRLGWSPTSKGSVFRYIEELRQLGIVEGSGRRLRVVR